GETNTALLARAVEIDDRPCEDAIRGVEDLDLGFLEHRAVDQLNEAKPAADRVEQAVASDHGGFVARAWDDQSMNRAAFERQPRRLVGEPQRAGEEQVAQHDMRSGGNGEITRELEPVGCHDLAVDLEGAVVEQSERIANLVRAEFL